MSQPLARNALLLQDAARPRRDHALQLLAFAFDRVYIPRAHERHRGGSARTGRAVRRRASSDALEALADDAERSPQNGAGSSAHRAPLVRRVAPLGECSTPIGRALPRNGSALLLDGSGKCSPPPQEMCGLQRVRLAVMQTIGQWIGCVGTPGRHSRARWARWPWDCSAAHSSSQTISAPWGRTIRALLCPTIRCRGSLGAPTEAPFRTPEQRTPGCCPMAGVPRPRDLRHPRATAPRGASPPWSRATAETTIATT